MECCTIKPKGKFRLGILECYVLEDLKKVGKLNWKSAGFFGAYNITKCLQDELYSSYVGIFMSEETGDPNRMDILGEISEDLAAFRYDLANPEKRQYLDPIEAALFA